MKRWISALLATGFLATIALTATANDNVTVQFGTDTANSKFQVMDNASVLLFSVEGDNNTTAAGTLSVTGAVTLADNLTLSNANGMIMNSSGNVTIADNLTLTDNLTLSNANGMIMNSAGDLVLDDNVTIADNLTLSNADGMIMNSAGDLVLDDNVTIADNLTLSNANGVIMNSADNVTINDNLTVTDNLTVGGQVLGAMMTATIKSADATITDADGSYIVAADEVTITLPAATASGRMYMIAAVGDGTLAPASGAIYLEGTSYDNATLAAGEVVTCIDVATNVYACINGGATGNND